jgi:hypothetical protein
MLYLKGIALLILADSESVGTPFEKYSDFYDWYPLEESLPLDLVSL